MKVKLFCAYGMTTDFLATEMKKAAGPDESVSAHDINFFEDEVKKDCDVALLGPQARMYLKDMRKAAEPYDVPVDVIEIRAYGRRDGAAVMEQARALLAQAKQS